MTDMKTVVFSKYTNKHVSVVCQSLPAIFKLLFLLLFFLIFAIMQLLWWEQC